MMTRDEQLHILHNWEVAPGTHQGIIHHEVADAIRAEYPDRNSYWNDRELLMAMIRANGLDVIDFEQMPADILGSREVALGIAMYYPNYYGLDAIIGPFKDDKDFMTQVVGVYGPNLKRASERLRDDPDVVRAAVRSNPDLKQYVMCYASERLQRQGLPKKSLADIVHDAERTARQEVMDGHSKDIRER